jgi:hypothetical protein
MKFLNNDNCKVAAESRASGEISLGFSPSDQLLWPQSLLGQRQLRSQKAFFYVFLYIPSVFPVDRNINFLLPSVIYLARSAQWESWAWIRAKRRETAARKIGCVLKEFKTFFTKRTPDKSRFRGRLANRSCFFG